MKIFFVALLLCLGLASSCGGDSDPAATPTSSPTTTDRTDTATPTSAAGQATDLPQRDLLDLAVRFRGLDPDTDRIARAEPYGYVAGEKERFNILDLAGPSTTTIDATLGLITEHAYFFVEDGIDYSGSDLERIGDDFESVVYPTVTARFGREWAPGVESDPRITILHARLSGAGGFFSGSDEYPIAVSPRSNEREMVYVDAGILDHPGAAYNALVAHELQHLAHWNADPTEDSWVNEGLSEVAAEEVTGGGASGAIDFFMQQPDTQLTFWPDIGDSALNYAASELFFGYLLDHYGGRERAVDLVAIESDSVTGVEEYLKEFDKTFDDVFADWTIANYADTHAGVYSHNTLDARVATLTRAAPGDTGEDEVGQFAADYIDIDPGAGTAFTFDGADETGVGVPEHDGAFWWSQRGDGIDTRLTRELDLASVSEATLRFQAWYEIENGWDYGYVAASTDGGATWTALPATTTTTYNPVEAAYGPGYTGDSDGWLAQEVDLSAYAGQELLVRFEFISDDATSFTGFAIDDIEVPEIAFADDADTDGEWDAQGFTRVTGPMKQEFIVQVVEGPRDDPAVTRVSLDRRNQAEIMLDGPAVIVVSGSTRDTAEKATYEWSVTAP